jgi:hypothetical protein
VYPAAASWCTTEPEALRQRIIKVRAHPDLPPMLAEYPFFRGLSNGHEFDLRLIFIEVISKPVGESAGHRRDEKSPHRS